MKKKIDNWDNPFSSFSTKYSKGKLVHLSGRYEIHSAVFAFSANAQHSGRYPIRGRVTALSSTGQILKVRGNEKKEILNNIPEHERDDSNRKLNIEKSFYCKSFEEEEIKNRIAKAAEWLYSKHGTLIQMQVEQNARPDIITPNTAAQLWAKRFVALRHNKSTEGAQEKWRKRISNICVQLPSKPMCKFSKKQMKVLCMEKNIGAGAQRELKLFWDFCIENGICSGTNPVDLPQVPKQSGAQLRNKAMRRYEMEPQMTEELYRLMDSPLTDASIGVALMLSGFDPKFIVGLKWSDIVFHQEKDFVTVKFFKDLDSNATKNYSRPVLPRVALMLRKHRKAAHKEAGKNDISDLYVVRNRKSKNNLPYKAEYLVNEATRLINNAGVSFRTLSEVRSLERENAAARIILRNTYERLIKTNCNLQDDIGTATFLLGQPFKMDVTSDAYTSFTSPEAEYRLYTILKICQKNHVIAQPVNTAALSADGQNHVFYAPRQAHDYVGITGEITLAPEEELIIKCSHGVEGYVEVETLDS